MKTIYIAIALALLVLNLILVMDKIYAQDEMDAGVPKSQGGKGVKPLVTIEHDPISPNMTQVLEITGAGKEKQMVQGRIGYNGVGFLNLFEGETDSSGKYTTSWFIEPETVNGRYTIIVEIFKEGEQDNAKIRLLTYAVEGGENPPSISNMANATVAEIMEIAQNVQIEVNNPSTPLASSDIPQTMQQIQADINILGSTIQEHNDIHSVDDAAENIANATEMVEEIEFMMDSVVSKIANQVVKVKSSMKDSS